MIGGSWNGNYGTCCNKTGEVWSNATGWTLLPGCPTDPLLTNDAQGLFRADNHAWLFAWKSGTIFQVCSATEGHSRFLLRCMWTPSAPSVLRLSERKQDLRGLLPS